MAGVQDFYTPALVPQHECYSFSTLHRVLLQDKLSYKPYAESTLLASYTLLNGSNEYKINFQLTFNNI